MSPGLRHRRQRLAAGAGAAGLGPVGQPGAGRAAHPDRVEVWADHTPVLPAAQKSSARNRLTAARCVLLRMTARTASGPVRDAVEHTFEDWTQRLEQLIAAAVELGQLVPCDPAQLAFEIQALLNAGGHVFRLCHDPKAPERGRAAIRQRLETLRGPTFPVLKE